MFYTYVAVRFETTQIYRENRIFNIQGQIIINTIQFNLFKLNESSVKWKICQVNIQFF